jgi:uncharacterized protein YhfF
MDKQLKELIIIAQKLQNNLPEIKNWNMSDKLELTDEIENLILNYKKQASRHKLK